MSSPVTDECCVTSLREPVQILSLVAAPSSQQLTSDLKLFSDGASLDKYLSSSVAQNYSCRFISICQRTSWRPLQVTSSMLSLIIDKHGFSSNIGDLTSCYYTKNNDLEDSFCAPFTVSTDGPWIGMVLRRNLSCAFANVHSEILYTIRYPEFKESENEWTIRQTGIGHRINTETRQSIVLLFGPNPSSKAFELTNPQSNSTFATYIDEPLRVGYDQLSALSSLEARFLKTTSLVASTTKLVNELAAFLDAFPEVINDQRRQTSILNSFKNHRRSCASYSQSAEFLKGRVQAASQLLANTLSFRDQVIANKQNSNMLQLNKSAVFITTLTLIYAPASFVATFFGMNFFAMDQPNSRIVCTTMIWIYIVTTFTFTIVTVIFYYWLLRHDGFLFGRLAPKVPVKDWTGFVRRLTKLDSSAEIKA
ncbi:hypothetical protein LLEC1_02057 [Akanthomyces lecanii]|uniref:Uncharacterized protein n=1 Tax=Cordyceps confragosa TaxID=2714763 RepID=A0A179IFC1_CORDF|nr:hypothetical protein LLEC1_02057 [Akanthomyces lecanii]